MSSDIRDFVMKQALFSHHDHHADFDQFESQRAELDYRALLGYAGADLENAGHGRGLAPWGSDDGAMAELWREIRTTGYGRAVTYTTRECFDLDYAPETWPQVTEALRGAIQGKTPLEVYDHFMGLANNRWVACDTLFRVENENALKENLYPDYYRNTFRMDSLFNITDAGPVHALERFTGVDILSLDRLAEALNSAITTCRETGRMCALKNGMAYLRDLVVGFPTKHEAETAFNRIVSRKAFHDGLQQNSGAVSAAEGRPLADWLFHAFVQRASDDDIPVQIHTGYLAGLWGSLGGTRAMNLVPVFERYQNVRFDIFHASWPWTSELGTIAKNYPNVHPSLCWMWAMNPTEAERALSEWLDGVPFTKIFGYGADTGYPWNNVGYSKQARIGIARVLEAKIDAGYFSGETAREVAEHIMLKNGEAFYGLG